ncbi:MAG: hypothetical protein AAF705_05710, partial [Bacteroidota bacterium]
RRSRDGGKKGAFWNDFPEEVGLRQADWAHVKFFSRAWQANNTVQEQQEIHRYWNRLRIVLSLRCMPYFIDQRKQRLADQNFFVYGMLLNSIMMQGKDTVLAVWNNPGIIFKFDGRFSLEHGFYLETIFYLETVIYHSRKFRWLLNIDIPMQEPVIPGFSRLIPFLSQAFPEETFNAWPDLSYNEENGQWKIGSGRGMTKEGATEHPRYDYFYPSYKPALSKTHQSDISY